MRGKPLGELSKLLLTRGLWFIALELFFFRFLLFFNADVTTMLSMLQVIWAIGWSLVVLAAVIHLPLRAIVLLSVATIALHNTLDGIQVTTFAGPGTPIPGFGASVWKILHERGVIFPFGGTGPVVVVLYPLIPWIAVMWAGYTVGSLYERAEPARRRALLQLGAALILGFLVLRGSNVYGDPSKWSAQATLVMSALSFLAVSKYPPSLLYLLMTLGPALLFLGLFDRGARGVVARVFITFGRVPLFFYCLQWFVSHTLAIVAVKLAGQPSDFLYSNIVIGPPPPPGFGFGLGTGVRALDPGVDPDLSAVRLVCRREGAPAGLVAVLRLRARLASLARLRGTRDQGLGIRDWGLGIGDRDRDSGSGARNRDWAADSALHVRARPYVASGFSRKTSGYRARPGSRNCTA